MLRPGPVSTLLFDLDGTLIDSTHLILTCFRHAFLTHLGDVPPDAAWIAGIGTPLATQMRQLVADQALAAEMVETYRRFQAEHHDELLREFPAVRPLLADLKGAGFRIGVVTSKMREPAQRGLQRAGLAELVEVLVAADSCPRHKPDPEPVLLALSMMNASPEQALFIGDSPHDIAAGNAAAVKTVGITWGPFPRSTLEAARPWAIIDALSDLVPLLAA